MISTKKQFHPLGENQRHTITHLKNLNDPKYRIICADLIKLGVLSVFLWMQDLNGVIF
jgi:hypothetical protein